MRTLAERLRAALDEIGASQADLARACGVKSPSVSAWLSGETKALKADSLVKAAAFLGVHEAWLNEGKGPRHLSKPESRTNVELGPDIKGEVPLISWVQAGPWSESCNVLDLADVERWLLCPVPHSKCTAALRVRGDSMTAPLGAPRSYPEGCFIFVDFEKKSPVNGQRIIAKINGDDGVTFKVFKEEDGRKWLQPLNPMHEPIRDEFKVLGTVIGTWLDE
jgi:SOS-response transcriptional repressor LexA